MTAAAFQYPQRVDPIRNRPASHRTPQIRAFSTLSGSIPSATGQRHTERLKFELSVPSAGRSHPQRGFFISMVELYPTFSTLSGSIPSATGATLAVDEHLMILSVPSAGRSHPQQRLAG